MGRPEKQAAILQRMLSSACSSTRPAKIQSSSLGSNHSSVRSHSWNVTEGEKETMLPIVKNARSIFQMVTYHFLQCLALE